MDQNRKKGKYQSNVSAGETNLLPIIITAIALQEQLQSITVIIQLANYSKAVHITLLDKGNSLAIFLQYQPY